MRPSMEAKSSEVGRELKASELRAHTIVWVSKHERAIVLSMWVTEVTASTVALYAGDIRVFLVLKRCGPDLESVEDDDRVPMKIFEYLGEV